LRLKTKERPRGGNNRAKTPARKRKKAKDKRDQRKARKKDMRLREGGKEEGKDGGQINIIEDHRLGGGEHKR